MPDQLYLRGRCEISFQRLATDQKYSICSEDYTFRVSKGGQTIDVKVLQDGRTIEADSSVDDFDPGIVPILKVEGYDKLTEHDRSQLEKMTSPIKESMSQLVGLAKQELNICEIGDVLIQNLDLEWSLGDNRWYPVPAEIKYAASIRIGIWPVLNRPQAEYLQELLSENEEALVATSYLHQARNSMNRRYQWIYATMAAELAIKEILVRIEPKLQVILGALPSPPLNRLYGDVLESVAGVKSTSLSKLQNGAQKRNQLVHNPKSPTPTFDEVKEYIDFIENRIRWLLKEWRRVKRVKKQQ